MIIVISSGKYGALTSKVSAFQYRDWNLILEQQLTITSLFGTNILALCSMVLKFIGYCQSIDSYLQYNYITR